jgi:hypothetical protein
MLGGFFCVSSTKKRKTSGNKTKKAKRSSRKTTTPKRGKKVNRKLSKGSRKGKKGTRKQTGGETINYDLTDGLGRGSYPVTYRSNTDCSGVHHK